MYHRLCDVRALPDYLLDATFVDGTRRRYDVKQLFGVIPAFDAMRSTPGLFALARVDTGGYGVVWTDKIDLSSEELWEGGEPVGEP